MALEGLAALALAGNLIQFVDFGRKLFSKSRELYRSSQDLSSENAELEKIAQFYSRNSKEINSVLRRKVRCLWTSISLQV